MSNFTLWVGTTYKYPFSSPWLDLVWFISVSSAQRVVDIATWLFPVFLFYFSMFAITDRKVTITKIVAIS